MDNLIKKAKRGNPIEKSYFDDGSDEEEEMKSGMGQGAVDEVTRGGEEEMKSGMGQGAVDEVTRGGEEEVSYKVVK